MLVMCFLLLQHQVPFAIATRTRRHSVYSTETSLVKSLAKDWVPEHVYLCRQSCDAKNEIQLCDIMAILHAFRIGNVVCIYFKSSRAMDYGEEWSPFLEEDVDHMIRYHTRRDDGRRQTQLPLGRRRLPLLSCKEDCSLKVSIWSTVFLYLRFEDVYRHLEVRGSSLPYASTTTHQQTIFHLMHP